MREDVEKLRALPDPIERAKYAGSLQDRLLVLSKEVSRIRREAVDELLHDGMSQTQIASALGMSRGRISQLVASGPPAERAFLGDDKLTVALAGKLEADKAKPGPVVSQEDFVAFEQLKELAHVMQLDADYEVIPPPGMVRLNRENLVVICGPRMSPLLAQVLESDPTLGFEQDDEGWHLVDRDTGKILPITHGL